MGMVIGAIYAGLLGPRHPQIFSEGAAPQVLLSSTCMPWGVPCVTSAHPGRPLSRGQGGAPGSGGAATLKEGPGSGAAILIYYYAQRVPRVVTL